jgi:hypothetical protein
MACRMRNWKDIPQLTSMAEIMKIRRLVSIVLLFSFVVVQLVYAVDGSKAMYVGGTVSTIKEKSDGKISAADEKHFTFSQKANSLQIPYDRVNGIEYGQKAGRRVGVAIMISPIALLSKKRKHYLTINYTDDKDKQQAVVFELGKDIVRVTLSSLEARTGQKIEYQDDEARNSAKGN